MGPRAEHRQRRVRRQLVLVLEPRQPALDGGEAAALVGGVRRDPDELDHTAAVTCGMRVLDRCLDVAALDVPVGGAIAQPAGQSRLPPLELVLEHVAEEMVEAIPAPLVVERDDEQVRPFVALELERGVRALQHVIAERTAHAVENRDAGEELDLRLGQALEQHEAEVVADIAVVPANARRGSASFPGRPQRQRRQIEPGGPAFGAAGQRFDLVARQLEAGTGQERLRLAHVQAQVAGSHLQHAALGAQPAEGQSRRRAGSEDELRSGRKLFDQERQGVDARRRVQHVDVVESHDDRRAQRRERLPEPGDDVLQ